jgi:hypothetical protein
VNQEREGIGRLDPVDGREYRGDHGLDRRVVGALETELGVGRGERIAVVELHALAQLEGPGGLPLELPLRRETRVQLAVGMPAREVVEIIEAPADVVGSGAEVGIELRNVPALGDDELLLLCRLGPRCDGRELGHRAGHAERRGSLEQFTSGDGHGRILPLVCIGQPSGYREP